MNDLKLIDVKYTDDYNKSNCGLCNRKIKNLYILNDNRIIGSECIFKILKDNLENNNNLYDLNAKLKKIKNLLSGTFVLCSELKKDCYSKDYPYSFEDGDFIHSFYIECYKTPEGAIKKDVMQKIFNISGYYEDLLIFQEYLNKNPSYIVLMPKIKEMLIYESKIKNTPDWINKRELKAK